ncbi:MAG TPA: serine/threonine-protein kinase, partial [Polyangiaceae bacterium]|nr:serine/threonine-protein kinase [Polyangiaceae bacterium]
MERRDERSRSSLSTTGPRPGRALGGGSAAAASSDAGDAEGTSSDAAPRAIGRYALHAEIAAGGMATIHIGRLLGPVGFAKTVAIKRLHPPLAKDPEFVAMFLDEARLAARIRHPNVVSTLDVVATQGELFVVMEYVPGESLARLLRAVRTAKEMVPVPIAATIMVGVLHGLHAAHEARDERGEPLRIVHRDVSPHNILVGTDGDAHLIDFGIAKARGRMQVTRQGQIKGKISYMPAEQLMGQGLDHRADIFAASIVLWESLTGQRLFQGTDDGDVYAKVLLGKVDAPSVHAKGLSPAIDAIVLRGLARDRANRYATAREMALALEGAIPLAPPSQVGRWVESLVGEALADRTEQIAGIERLVDGGGDLTSSTLMTIGAGPQPANEQNDGPAAASATASRLSRMDRTGPTQPLGAVPARMADPTVVDRPAASVASAQGARQLHQLEEQSAPRRSSRRAIATLALLLVPLAVYGGVRTLQGRSGAAIPAHAVAAGPPEKHAATLEPSTSQAQSTDWLPVPVSPQSETASASPAGPVMPAAAVVVGAAGA